jgi:hypothetical protein
LRGQNAALATDVAFGASSSNTGFFMRPRTVGNDPQFAAEGATSTLSVAKTGLFSLVSRSGAEFYRNGVSIGTNSGGNDNINTLFSFGSNLNIVKVVDRPCAIDFSYWYIGEALTDSQELDHYNIVQSLQAAFSRQV